MQSITHNEYVGQYLLSTNSAKSDTVARLETDQLAINIKKREAIPNGAWGKNSLKKDIREEILDILRWPYNKRPVRLTQSEALRQQRATDILNLIESVIPEEATGNVFVEYIEGYNQAISDIKSKLRGGE